MKRIKVTKEKCTSCGICEMVCSITKNGVLNIKNSRIKVKELYPLPGYPTLCIQCKVPLCKKVCPVNAIYINKDGIVIIDYEKCIKCMKCVSACPFETMFVEIDSKKPIKCDLCMGDPECIKYCPTGAIEYK